MTEATCPRCGATVEIITSVEPIRNGFDVKLGTNPQIVEKCVNPQTSTDPKSFCCPDFRPAIWRALQLDEPEISPSPIYRTAISDETSIFPVQTVGYKGTFWLAPTWIVDDQKGWRRPARLIGLGPLQFQDLRGTGAQTDFSVPVAIPRLVFDCLVQGIEVAGWPVKILENPPILFPIPPEDL